MRGKKQEKEELLFNEHRGLVWNDENVLEMDGGDDWTKMWMYLI